MYNFRTDLALERRDLYKKANHIENEVEGIETEQEKIGEEIITTRVKVLNKQGEDAIGKPIGNYITIDIKNLKIANEDEIRESIRSCYKRIKILIRKSY